MTTLAGEGGSPAFSAPRPSFGDAVVATILGWIAASLALLVPVLLAHWLGLVGRPGFVSWGGEGLRDWPYARNGAFSLLANLVVWLSIVGLTALFVRGMLSDRVGPLSAVPIFVVLAVTGFVPLLPHGVLDMPGVIAFLASAWLIRAAVATTPIPPLSKRVTTRIVAVCAILLAIPAWYGLTHPLWQGSVVTSDSARTLTFGLRNGGFAEVRVESISLSTSGPAVALAGIKGDRQPPFTIGGREEALVQLRLRHLGGCGSGGELPGDAVVRYRLLGSVHVARVPVELPVKACARG
jgi:hypothetical protein